MLRTTIAAIVLSIAGCGLEDYEARMNVRLAELQEMTRYASLYAPTRIDYEVDGEKIEYPITIRLPRVFQDAQWYRGDSAYGGEAARSVPNHILYPPFLLEFPGFNRVGQGMANSDPQTLHSFYCYLGVLESRAAKFEAVLADLRKKTAAKLPQTGQWQDVVCKDENLVATTWKMFEAKGKQKFIQKSGPYEDTLDAAGTFRVYAREDQGYIVLFGVRIPDALASEVYLLDLADAVVGTVKVTEPAPTGPVPPPKPKTKKPADDMPPADETPAEDQPGQEQPGAVTPNAPAEKGAEKGTAKPPAEEEDWSSEKNDQAPAETPTEEQPPTENADAAMPEAAPSDEGATSEGAAESPAEGEMPTEETPPES